MVIDKIVTGISLKIREIFGVSYKVYDDNVKQGMEKPCFFINYLDGNENRDIGINKKNYIDILHFDITGFSKNDDTPSLMEMADKLYDLEYITLTNNALIRADKMQSKIEDGVLHFFIDYKLFICKGENDNTQMNNYDLNGEVKKDG